jgi:hypothetical protein
LTGLSFLFSSCYPAEITREANEETLFVCLFCSFVSLLFLKSSTLRPRKVGLCYCYTSGHVCPKVPFFLSLF